MDQCITVGQLFRLHVRAMKKSKLISAVKAGDTERVVDLLDGGVPIDTKGDMGMSLLHLAALGGHVDTMRLLIRRGCDVDSVDSGGEFTPLHCAAAMGQTKAVRELIRKGASKSVVAGRYETPQAALKEDKKTAEAMLEQGQSLCVVARGKSLYYGTALDRAAFNGHVETAVAMLEEGCPLNVVNSAGATVLHFAARGGNADLVRELVGRGCDVNAVTVYGWTPLHSAAGCGRTEAVRELIKLGAAKSVVGGNCGTPLNQAAVNGHVETAVAMLEEGCPLDVVSSAGTTVLHFAAQGGNVDLVRELVSRGCDVNAVKANGSTPLHDAASCGRTEAVRELIKLGATKSVDAGNRGTPLHQAACCGHVKTAVAMLEEGCPLDVVSSAAVTVLHAASQGGNVELVRELVSRGCDVNAVEANGCIPLHFAAVHGRTEAVRELIKLGAAKSVVRGNSGSPLHQAAFKGHVETAVAMLEEGCSLDVVSSAGVTVLDSAVQSGNVDLVRELVGRGCNVNAVKANSITPLHYAANCGRTQAVCELIKLGAAKSVVVGRYGTPLHQAVLNGHVETVGALLEDDLSEHDMASHDVTPLKGQVLDSGIIGTCDSLGRTPVMWALRCGQVDVLKLLISKGGSIRSDRDQRLLCAFEHCFIGGQASKLSQLCEASGIRSGGEGLRGVLTTLITQGLAEAHKVLCLCAISGDSVFLDDNCIDLVASDACAMPAAVTLAKEVFYKSVPFLNQLRIPDENALNPLHISLLSLKCFEMGFITPPLKTGVKDHTSFITKLLSHPVLKKTVHENFPNGLSPLDLARQFELHHIAALIEGAGGRPGVWAGVPQEIEFRHPLALPQVKEAYASIKAIAEDGEHGLEFIKGVFSSILGAQTVESVVQVADDSLLVKEQVLGQRPDLGNVVTHVLPRIQVRTKWKRVGLALGMKKTSLDQFSNDDDPYLEALSYWLEHGSSVTWKTLLDVLGHFETKHTVDELTDKIVSVLGGSDQVPLQLPTPPGSTGDIEKTSSKRTAQLSWPPAKQRRTSDAEGEPSLRKRPPEGTLQDQSPAKRVVRCALTGSEGTVEAVGVSSSAPVESGGAVAAERSPPVCEAKQVLGHFRDQFIADVDANTVVWELLYKNIIPRGVQERISRTDEPKQQNEILHDCLQRTCTKEALMEACDIIVAVRGNPKMRELGEAMKRRLHTATPVQVVQDHAEEFLEKMNSTVLAPQLKALGLIPEAVECDILQSKSREEANAHLLNHLKEDADEESVREVFRIASEKTGYGKMKVFAADVLRELQ